MRALVVIAAVLALWGEGCGVPVRKDLVCARGQCVAVEISDTEEERSRGLQDRSVLPADGGMLFVFQDPARHAFWMKDTLISLDMIWLDASRRIVHIEKNVPPCTSDPCPAYSPAAESSYVLEVNAGRADAWGLAVGEQMEFRLDAYLAR